MKDYRIILFIVVQEIKHSSNMFDIYSVDSSLSILRVNGFWVNF